MAPCYNFSRVLRMIGFDRWMALLAQRAAKPITTLFLSLLGVCRRIAQRLPPSDASAKRARMGLR